MKYSSHTATVWTFLILLSALSACGSDLEEENLQIQELEREVENLKEEIRQTDDFITDFSRDYEIVSLALDSMEIIGDSLREIQQSYAAYPLDSIAAMEESLSRNRQLIDQLRRQLETSNPDNQLVKILESQLLQAEKRIRELSEVNDMLVAENATVRSELSGVRTSLNLARNDATSAREQAKTASERLDRLQQESQSAISKANAERERLARESRLKESQVHLAEAKGYLRQLNELIVIRGGKPKLPTRKSVMQKAEVFAAGAAQALSEAKRLGNQEAARELDRLFNEPVYQSLIPSMTTPR